MRFAIVLLAASFAFAADPAPVSKAAIEARLKDMHARREQLLANINATNGAIEDLQFWLDQLVLAEKQAKPEPTAKAEPSVEYVVAKKEK